MEKSTLKKMVRNNDRRKWFSPEVRVVLSFLLAIVALSLKLPVGEQGEFIDGWGLQTLIIALGLFGIFWQMRERSRQRNYVLNAVCIFFALFTVLGPSFVQTQSWDSLFADGAQGIRTFVLGGGTA